MTFKNHKVFEQAASAMHEIDKYIDKSGLEKKLLELIYIRVSQINKCAYCIDKHVKLAREMGETEQRVYGLNAWEETSFYSNREKAALGWAESLTRLPENNINDDLYETVHKYYSDSELVSLTMAIVSINGWNRLTKGFRSIPGSFKPELTK